MPVRLLFLLTLFLAAWMDLASAELTEADEQHFTTRHELLTPAKPAAVFRVMTAGIDQWWNPAHSWSGDGGNLYLDAEPGGCFCERLPDGGFAEHLRIIYLAPGAEIRFDGTLGPLQTMAVQGRMTWSIEAAEPGSRVTFTYRVFGHPERGLTGIAPAVDGVIGEQLQRLGERLTREP
jgi:uncharacterized protein YndB with AHSA1/START domain